jgi:hypothetical protein
MSDWLIIILFGCVFLLTVLGTTWLVSQLVNLFADEVSMQQFRKDLIGAIKHSQPQWDELVEIIQSRQLSQRNAYLVVRHLLRDVLTGTKPELVPHRKLLEDYIMNYKTAEPFEGLPSEIRVQLKRLQEALNGNHELLEPLTEQIKELVSVYEKDKSRQRQYTIGGIVLAVFSFAFSIYTYFHPYPKW